MVARGDLGVECLPEEVPLIQKMLIQRCRELNKPVITATQMLESMTANPRPTRAEASDVANAIMDGTDAIMLSAESASGKYPIESVAMMDRIARITEASSLYRDHLKSCQVSSPTTSNSIAVSACTIAEDLDVKAIVCFTSSGSTAAQVSSKRPNTTIIASTPNVDVCNQMALLWGVVPMIASDIHNTDEMVSIADLELKASGAAVSGDRYVITAGVPFGQSGSTNMIRVERLK
jgi:pyruvate kinase